MKESLAKTVDFLEESPAKKLTSWNVGAEQDHDYHLCRWDHVSQSKAGPLHEPLPYCTTFLERASPRFVYFQSKARPLHNSGAFLERESPSEIGIIVIERPNSLTSLLYNNIFSLSNMGTREGVSIVLLITLSFVGEKRARACVCVEKYI